MTGAEDQPRYDELLLMEIIVVDDCEKPVSGKVWRVCTGFKEVKGHLGRVDTRVDEDYFSQGEWISYTAAEAQGIPVSVSSALCPACSEKLNAKIDRDRQLTVFAVAR